MKRLTFAAVILAAIGCASFASAFTVIKNVNTGQPPVEKAVIFDKARGTANKVTFVQTGMPTAINADGAIKIDIMGNVKSESEINWQPQGDPREDLRCHQIQLPHDHLPHGRSHP